MHGLSIAQPDSGQNETDSARSCLYWLREALLKNSAGKKKSKPKQTYTGLSLETFNLCTIYTDWICAIYSDLICSIYTDLICTMHTDLICTIYTDLICLIYTDYICSIYTHRKILLLSSQPTLKYFLKMS